MERYFLSTKRFLPLIAAVAALMLAATGCGGEADSGSAAAGITTVDVETGSLSKAEFIEQADAICEEASKKVQLAGQAFVASVTSRDSTGKALKTEGPKFLNDVFIPAYEEEVEEVSALGAPSGDAQEVTALLEVIQKGLAEAAEEPVKYLQDPDPFPGASRLARAYGFETCGKL